jgi:choice-of-anchor B domain-containing protein
MPTPQRLAAAVGLAALVLSPLALTHEGDPKILDLEPPYEGPGFRSGRPDVLAGGKAAVAAPEFPADGVQLLSWLPLSELAGGTSANSCYGYTSPSGREYALIGLRSGTGVVEITNPGDPQVIATVPGPTSLWRDVRTYADHMYMVSEGGEGIQVADLSQVDAGVVTLVGTVLAGGVAATHTVFIDEVSGFLYRAGGGQNGLRIYDLSTPASPQLVGTWSDRYVHEVTVVTYPSGPYAGRQIAFCCGGFNSGWSNTGVSILDVTNKGSIQVLDHFSYPGARYCHQAWPSEDLTTLYINDELDENGSITTNTKVVDITDLSNPVVKQPFSNSSTAIGHNLYVKGDRIYEANYRSGLRVFDNSDPLKPVEVAWFDTWPEDDGAKFNGLWNNYPYFQSGVVIGSDIERGLFVWWVGDPQLTFAYPAGLPDVIDLAGEPLTVSISEQAAGALVPGSEELHYDDGTGWQSVPLVAQGGGQYSADLPALDCGQTVAWYVSARSTNGITWTDPQGGPVLFHESRAAQSAVQVALEDLESSAGWELEALDDTATEGRWILVAPQGSVATPGFDRSPGAGSRCALTQQQGVSGLPPNAHDVDGGKTTLTSPPLDASGLGEAWISYWRWFSNDKGDAPGEDVFEVQVSSSASGGPWVPVETVGPTGPGTQGGWVRHQFRLTDFVAPSATVRLRFIASDTGDDSLIEAAVDDLELLDLACPPGDPSSYCTPKTNGLGCLPHLTWSGEASASGSTPFVLTARSVVSAQQGLLFYGYAPAALPFQGGLLCVAPPIERTAPQPSGGPGLPNDCSGTLSLDFNARIQSGTDPALVPGVVVHAQIWTRDPFDPSGFGTSLSDAVAFTIQP